jgi:hypothetical protein
MFVGGKHPPPLSKSRIKSITAVTLLLRHPQRITPLAAAGPQGDAVINCLMQRS